MFVRRLSSLGALADRLEENEQVLAHGSRDEVANLLARVKGVGPVVLATFMALRGNDDRAPRATKKAENLALPLEGGADDEE